MKIIKFPEFRRRKIRVHSQTHLSSHLDIIVTAQFLAPAASHTAKRKPAVTTQKYRNDQNTRRI